MKNHELAQQIRIYRAKKGISQQKLADMLETTRQSVAMWENGKGTPSFEYTMKLVELLKE